jgi:hypothetical protein
MELDLKKKSSIISKEVNGKYAMLSRIDGVNNYLMYSDSVTQWDNPILLQNPRYSWEFTQIGNCGSGLQKDG